MQRAGRFGPGSLPQYHHPQLHGGEFAAAVARDNVFAVQFHPEKSQSAGRRVLDAFAAWVASCA